MSDMWKLTLLGDGGVGKTALATQLTREKFFVPDTYEPSIEDTSRKQIEIDNRTCLVEIWDTVRPEECWPPSDVPIREGQGFVLLYSIASRETFERIEVYYQRMLRVKTEPPVFILVGNKCDVARREVSREEGERRAQALGCQFFETSAKTAYNVEKVFLTLVRLLRVEQHPAATDVSEKSKRKLKLRCVLM